MERLKERFLNREKVKNYLGICRKAGYIIIGSDNLKNYDKKMYLILADKNLSKTMIKIVERFPKIETIYVEDLAELVGIENCKIIAIKNHGLVEEIKKYIIGD